MANVFVYDETRIDYFVTDTHGDLSGTVTGTEDLGSITDADPPIEYDSLQFNINNWGFVARTEDFAPFGTVAALSGTVEKVVYSPQEPYNAFLLQSSAGIAWCRTTWIGSGTLFEIGGGLERLVIPDLGAAGPSPVLSGQSHNTITATEVGSGTALALSEAETYEFNVYPVDSTIEFKISGGTTQTYPNEWIQSIVEEELNGTALEAKTFYYGQSDTVLEDDNYGWLAGTNGNSFDDSTATFDSNISNQTSWSDGVEVEQFDYGSVAASTTQPEEDYGEIVIGNRYGTFWSQKLAAYDTSADYRKVFEYHGSGSLPTFDSGRTIPAPHITGSGTISISGQLGLSQAPQHTVFGGDFGSLVGTAEEAFVPALIRGSGLQLLGGAASEAITYPTDPSTMDINIGGYAEQLKLTHYPPTDTATLVYSGGITNERAITKETGSTLFSFVGELTHPDIDYTPHWKSALEIDGYVEPVDLGLITEAVTPPIADYGWVREVATTSDTWGYVLPQFNNISVVGVGGEAFVRDAYQGSGILAKIGIADVSRPFFYTASGQSGIATHNAGINIFGYYWFSQAPQHTVFGLEGEFTIQGSKDESFTPAPLTGSGTLGTISGAATDITLTFGAGERTMLFDTGGTAGVTFSAAPKGEGTVTLSQGREAGQTYRRVIYTDTDIVLFRPTNTPGSIFEKNTESYNESAIYIPGENADWGDLSGTPARDSGNQGVTYDDTNYDFSTTNVSEDFGEMLSGQIPGGPPYDRFLYPYYTGFEDQDIDRGYADFGWVDDDTVDAVRTPFGKISIEQPSTQTVTRYIPRYPGTGTFLALSGAAEILTFDPLEGAPLFSPQGQGKWSLVWQSPENTAQLSVVGICSHSFSRVTEGSGQIDVNPGGIQTYRRIIDITSTGIINLTGYSGEEFVANPPEGSALFDFWSTYSNLNITRKYFGEKPRLRLQGELNHPQIDYTPHYGIDRNIGIETGITLSPGGGTDRITGITTASFIPKYPGGQSSADGRGGHTWEVLKLSGKSISRTNAPIVTDGTIYILGIGTAGNGNIDPITGVGDLDGVEFGATWAFTPATARGGPGLYQFKGTAPSREIAVYGYYGDDRDPGTSGLVTISTEKDKTVDYLIKKYSGDTVSLSVTGTLTERQSFAYDGSGTFNGLSGAAESTTDALLAEGTWEVRGSANEAYSAQTPEETATFTVSGTGPAFRLRQYAGSGTATLNNTEKVVTGVRFNVVVDGTFSSFGGASISQTIPGAASGIIFHVGGTADTREIANYGYYGDDKDPGTSGTITISGELLHPDIDYTPSPTGTGDIIFGGAALKKFSPVLIGSGSATFVGIGVEKFITAAQRSTILFAIAGDADESLQHVFGYYGDDKDPGTSGSITILGSGDTAPIQNFGYYGDDKDPGTSGTITISGTPLIHPEVDFTPSPDGSGLFVVTGTVGVKRAWAPVYAEGSLYGFSSGEEAYARTSYIGIGTANFFSNSLTEISRYEEPRTYVVII
tara:strand:- start:4396 stop:8880 length:4485 start_codon:yes stop_codon:yes gene_type:complete